MSKPKRIAMTLDIQEGKIEEYHQHHINSWPEVESALRSVGMRNLSLYNWESRLFYYAEYVGTEPFEEAMARYAEMPKVKEWEELMHKYQKKLPGSTGDVWWQEMKEVYHQD